MGGSPGLVVMGGDSRSKGRGFKSIYWMDICCKNCNVCFKRAKTNEKVA